MPDFECKISKNKKGDKKALLLMIKFAKMTRRQLRMERLEDLPKKIMVLNLHIRGR